MIRHKLIYLSLLTFCWSAMIKIWCFSESVVALVLEGLFVVLQHLSILVRGDSVETCLIVLVDLHCAIVSDVFESFIESALGGDEGHEVLDGSQGAWSHIVSVVPETIFGRLVVLLIIDSLLLGLGRSVGFLLFAGIPEVSVDGGEEDESNGSSQLNGVRCTGPSLLAALKICSLMNPGFFSLSMPLSSWLNLRLPRLGRKRGTAICARCHSWPCPRICTTY